MQPSVLQWAAQLEDRGGGAAQKLSITVSPQSWNCGCDLTQRMQFPTLARRARPQNDSSSAIAAHALPCALAAGSPSNVSAVAAMAAMVAPHSVNKCSIAPPRGAVLLSLLGQCQ
jgi:hypothetical protein